MIGNWNENKLIEGKWVLPNGNYFTGRFENNRPSGEGLNQQYKMIFIIYKIYIGQWTFKNGDMLKGTYLQHILPLEEDGGIVILRYFRIS